MTSECSSNTAGELTVIIPAFNEENGLLKSLPGLIEICRPRGWQIIVVDDGSNDRTSEVAESFQAGVMVIRHSINLGYGAAIKTGVLATTTDFIATFDADGQHRATDLISLIEVAKKCHAAIGARTADSIQPISRAPGRLILRFTANLIAGLNIPDINCGLRVIHRNSLLRVMGLTSDKFSFSTSTLLALLKTGHDVRFVPVTIDPRVGKSSVRQVQDGLGTLLLVTRLLVLFEPIRIFVPTSIILIFLAFIKQCIEMIIYGVNISTSTLLLLISGVVIFFFSLLADQIASLRREIASFDHDPRFGPRNRRFHEGSTNNNHLPSVGDDPTDG